MNTIQIDADTYNQVKVYADDKSMSVDAFVIMLIKRVLKTNTNNPKPYQMKSLQQLTPEVQSLVGLAKHIGEQEDLNGSNVKYEYLKEKYESL